MALIGQTSVTVFPRQRVQPCLKGLVLDCLILNWISTEMSWGDRLVLGEYSSCDDTVNLLHPRTRKKVTERTAHVNIIIVVISWLFAECVPELLHNLNHDGWLGTGGLLPPCPF